MELDNSGYRQVIKICATGIRPANNGFSPSRSEGENPGAEPVPLFSATLRENQGHETDRSAAAQPRD